MKTTAKRIEQDVSVSFAKGVGLDPVEITTPFECWEVRFVMEKHGDTLSSDFPLFDYGCDLAIEAIEEAGRVGFADQTFNYHLEAGPDETSWGVLVFEVVLVGQPK